MSDGRSRQVTGDFYCENCRWRGPGWMLLGNRCPICGSSEVRIASSLSIADERDIYREALERLVKRPAFDAGGLESYSIARAALDRADAAKAKGYTE